MAPAEAVEVPAWLPAPPLKPHVGKLRRRDRRGVCAVLTPAVRRGRGEGSLTLWLLALPLALRVLLLLLLLLFLMSLTFWLLLLLVGMAPDDDDAAGVRFMGTLARRR